MLGMAPSFEVEVADVLADLSFRFIYFIATNLRCQLWSSFGSCRLESWNDGNLLRICLPNSLSAGNRPVLGSGYVDVLGLQYTGLLHSFRLFLRVV